MASRMDKGWKNSSKKTTRLRQLSRWPLEHKVTLLSCIIGTAGGFATGVTVAGLNGFSLYKVEKMKQEFVAPATPRPDSTQRPASGPVVIPADGTPREVAPGITVSLAGVETLKGSNKQGRPNLGHAFNKKLADREHVFDYMLASFAGRSHTPRQVLEMSQEQWNTFLRAQPEESRRRILNTPFAALRVSVGGAPDASYEGRHFFKGETVEIRGQTSHLQCRVARLYATRADLTGEPPAVVLDGCRMR